jgi:hypothetical protein
MDTESAGAGDIDGYALLLGWLKTLCILAAKSFGWALLKSVLAIQKPEPISVASSSRFGIHMSTGTISDARVWCDCEYHQKRTVSDII